MKLWQVWFRFSKYKGGYSHRTVDWTLVEAENAEEAEKEAKRWVRENRCEIGWRHRTKILEARELH